MSCVITAGITLFIQN